MKLHPYLSLVFCRLRLLYQYFLLLPVRQYLFAVTAFFVMVILTLYAQIVNASVWDVETEAMAVHELMRLDTELALNASRTRLEQAGVATGTVSAMAAANSGQLKLVAIYGVGKKLMAEVFIDGQPYVYMRGMAAPVGGKAATAAYKLAGISGSCVHLQGQEQAHTLCLHPSLRVAR